MVETFQKNNDEMLGDIPNICGMNYGTITYCYDSDGQDYDQTLEGLFTVYTLAMFWINPNKGTWSVPNTIL